MDNRKSVNNIRFISWNVKGANQAIKINKIMTHVQGLGGEVVFLQETHLRTGETLRIKRGKFNHLFHSKFSDRSRGAAILIQNHIPFQLEKLVADSFGRFVIVSGQLCNIPVILASVYAPNWDDAQFISRFFTSMPNIENYHNHRRRFQFCSASYFRQIINQTILPYKVCQTTFIHSITAGFFRSMAVQISRQKILLFFLTCPSFLF